MDEHKNPESDLAYRKTKTHKLDVRKGHIALTLSV